jgi:DNA polymerase III epsilon subunit family exonuclease
MEISQTTYKALSIENFITFDVETTGLDPKNDEIIEIGIVKVEMGKICNQFSQLFKPSVPISRVITQITGIKPEDCRDKPLLKESITEITPFFKEGWIISHNAVFDVNFLQNTIKMTLPNEPELPRERILDTLELSRFLLPDLPNHKLETVAQFFNINSNNTHRALTDSKITSDIFKELVFRIIGLDIRAIQILDRILEGTNDGLRFFIEKVKQFIETHNSGKKIKNKICQTNVIGNKRQRKNESIKKKINKLKIDQFFKSDGLLNNVIPRYEFRKPQYQMSELIGKSLNQNAFLLAEAGTGVGKSLSYLIPIILFMFQNSKSKTIISTNTKTLQDQLFKKDIPLLYNIIDQPFRTVLLKGRSNYLCLKRWNQLVNNLDFRLTSDQRRKLIPLILWAFDTQTGDIEENSGFSRKYNFHLWSQLNCEEGYCINSRCPYEAKCYLQNVRRSSRAADIVIVNHSLLFTDLINDHSILGNYDTLVVDEAHHIEQTASKYLGSSLHIGLFLDIIQKLYSSKSNETGIIIAALNNLKDTNIKGKEYNNLIKILDTIKILSIELLHSTNQFFNALESVIGLHVDENSKNKKLRIRSSDKIFGYVKSETDNVDTRKNYIYNKTFKSISEYGL